MTFTLTTPERVKLERHCAELHETIDALEGAAKRAIKLGQDPTKTLEKILEIREPFGDHADSDPLFAAAWRRCTLAIDRLQAHWLRKTGRTLTVCSNPSQPTTERKIHESAKFKFFV